MESINLYQWAADHNPAPTLSFRKGLWAYVQFLYHLDELYGENRTTVVSTYEMNTPPPQEMLLMPVARAETERAAFILKSQFDGLGLSWTASVIRKGSEQVSFMALSMSVDRDRYLQAQATQDIRRCVMACYSRPGSASGKRSEERTLSGNTRKAGNSCNTRFTRISTRELAGSTLGSLGHFTAQIELRNHGPSVTESRTFGYGITDLRLRNHGPSVTDFELEIFSSS